MTVEWRLTPSIQPNRESALEKRRALDFQMPAKKRQHWQARLNKSEFIAYQASARGGIVQVRVEGERVKLGGNAVTVLEGELHC